MTRQLAQASEWKERNNISLGLYFVPSSAGDLTVRVRGTTIHRYILPDYNGSQVADDATRHKFLPRLETTEESP